MDHPIQINDRAVARLLSLSTQLEGPLKTLVDHLAAEPASFARKAALLAEFRDCLAALGRQPGVDRAAVADTLETILDLLGVESSDGLLNEWMLGISL